MSAKYNKFVAHQKITENVNNLAEFLQHYDGNDLVICPRGAYDCDVIFDIHYLVYEIQSIVSKRGNQLYDELLEMLR